VKTRSGFQQSLPYERIFAWRFPIGIILLLLAVVVVWLIARPGPSTDLAATPGPAVAEISETAPSSADTPSAPDAPTSTPAEVSAPATSQATPTTEASSAEAVPTETSTAVPQATSTPIPTATPSTLPTATSTPSPVPTAMPTVAPAAQTYRVVRGDSLWKIALQFYGDGQRWRDIYDANRDIIADPRLLRTGWELRIP